MTRVLVADDETGITTIMKLNLEKRDYEVEVVNDPFQILDKARSFKPDILLLDIMMPGKDGGDILAEMRSDPGLQSLPTLILTALVGSGTAEAGSLVETPNGLMLAKPVSVDRLVECIENKLAGRI